MLNWLLKLIVPDKAAQLFRSAQDFLRGKKTYLAGTVLVLQALAAILEQFTGLDGLSGLLGWIKGMSGNAAVGQFALGLGMLGLRAGMEKQSQ